jgi:acyl-coenzyme A synthetase/AMP-(fatty) acid ligase/thioesterase domain-containing protein
MTYGELERAANQIANAIDARDPDGQLPTVALAMDQGLDAIVTIVAAAKSKRTVVPLDPDNPPFRVAEILEQVPPAVVLLTESGEPALASVPHDRRILLRVDEIPADAPDHRVAREIESPDAWALVIFTSGTTGRPKGVVFSFGRETRPRKITPAWEQWMQPEIVTGIVTEHQWALGYSGIRMALGLGGTIAHYATRRRGAGDLCRFLAEAKVQSTGGAPSLFRAALDADPDTMLPDLELVSFLGEALPRQLVVDLFDRVGPECQIYTSYASSEAGGVASLMIGKDSIPDGDIVPAGEIVEEVDVDIEDPDEHGVGRIVVVTGRGSQGYVNDQGAGDVIEQLAGGRKRHRTGDLGRIREDGMLEVRGRYAFLVKVNGQRVDAIEVELALKQARGVADAVVGVHPDDPAHRLTAWYVAPGEGAPNVGDLRRHLRPLLPAYMVPAAYVRLDALPLGTRGKLDRSQLPLPTAGRPDLGHPYEAPVGDYEAAVAEAFARVAEVEPVGRNDAFFDLGGDSLGAAEVMTRLRAGLGRDLPLSVFLEASTPAELADRLLRADAEERLVVMQPEGELEPIYCMHGGGGQILNLANLAERLGTHRPFIGLQMRQTDRARVLFRIGRLADRYADEIAARQGTSPCVVAGHSYGGVLAQDLSRRLVARGVPVKACVLIDSFVPRRRFLAGAKIRKRALGPDDNTTSIKEVLYAAHAALGLPVRPNRVTTERMIAALWGLGRFRPTVTSVPLVLIRAVEQVNAADPSAWAQFTTAGLEVVDVPGDHHSMLAPPHVHRVAEAVRAQLDAALARA